MSRDVEGEQATMDQKMNELVQQSRVLEAYMNDIVGREATITRLDPRSSFGFWRSS